MRSVVMGLFCLLSSSGCGVARPLVTDRPLLSIDAPARAPTAGWLDDVIDSPAALVPGGPCARAVPEGTSSFREDMHPSPGVEHVLVGWGRIAVLDASCGRVLHRSTHAPFVPGEPIATMGPTRRGVGWDRLSAAEQARMHSVDAVGGGLRLHLGVVRSERGPIVVLHYEGWAPGARRGYHAVLLRCEHDGCRTLSLAHVETTGAGSAPCERYRSALSLPDHAPLLWIAPEPSGALELTQFFVDRPARPCLGPLRAEPVPWRVIRWDGREVEVRVEPLTSRTSRAHP